jgi:hypothetical protein
LECNLAKVEAEKKKLERKVKDMVWHLEDQRQKAEIELLQQGNIARNQALKQYVQKEIEYKE